MNPATTARLYCLFAFLLLLLAWKVSKIGSKLAAAQAAQYAAIEQLTSANE